MEALFVVFFLRNVPEVTVHPAYAGEMVALRDYHEVVERKIFWIVFTLLGIIADVVLPIWWALAATIPIGILSWWIAYRSDWF